MFSSFYAGVSGLSNFGMAMNVIGDNIANINTIGFKEGVPNFSDLMCHTIGSGATGNIQLGLGSKIAGINASFHQGSIQSSNNPTDTAIQGNGFFILSDSENNKAYTRAGNFQIDEEGFLINSGGMFVQGWTSVDEDGNINTNGDLGNINIPQGLTVPPKATSLMNMNMNLDANAEEGDTFASSITVYDSLGTEHLVTLTFTKTANPGEWDCEIACEDGTIDPGEANVTVEFDGDGNLITPADNVEFNITDWNTGANDSAVTWELYDEDDNGYITGYASTSTTSNTHQNGYSAGIISTIVVEEDGTISGIFSNGTSSEIARLALANFNNPDGLSRKGDTMYVQTGFSGDVVVGTPDSGGRGSIIPNALEMSNVDLAKEFTKMILFQRGYQANSRIIRTTDEFLQELMTIKR